MRTLRLGPFPAPPHQNWASSPHNPFTRFPCMCTPCAGGRPHQTAAAKKLAKLQISDNHNSATGRRFKIQIAAAVLIQIVAQQAAPFHGVKQLARYPERAHRRAGRGRHNHRPALTTHDHTKLKNRNKRSIPTNARAMIGITTAHVASSYPSSPYADNGCGVKRPTILSRTSFNSHVPAAHAPKM